MTSPSRKHRVADLMTHSHSEPAPVALAGFTLKALTRDRKALRDLIACVLAVVSTAIEPPYLSLSTPKVQTALRATIASPLNQIKFDQ